MFLGHFAAGFAASRVEPRLPLGAAFLSAQLADVVWPVFVLLGVERVSIRPGDTVVTPLAFESYPYSHSLVADLGWALLAGLLCVRLGLSHRAGAFATALVVSHWVLDVVSHRPDMPVLPWGGPLLGFGLWNSLPLTLVVEFGLFSAAVAAYASTRHPPPRLWFLAGSLAAIYVASVFGPPPPSVAAVAVSGLVAGPLLFVWGNWVGPSTKAQVRERPK